MNITLHRTTLMVCMLAGALALTIALVAAKDVSAAPSPERAGGATQISGDAPPLDSPEVAADCPPLPVDPVDPVEYQYALVMHGDLEGCLYTHFEPGVSSPSGTYRETGTELFVGVYKGEVGTFKTTYRFEAKYDLSGEIFGRCQHPIVEGSGTGVFEGVTGILFFKDIIEAENAPYYLYRGHLRG
jgi:hypothetical protein